MIYLVNPSEKEILENAGDRIPLGLLSIGTILKRMKMPVKIYDLNHYSKEKFYDDVFTELPRVVGISVYTSPMYNEAVKLANNLKGHTRIIAGGYHATAMPESLRMFDSIVYGEGEIGIINAQVNDGLIHSSMVDLHKLPPLDYSLLNMEDYGVNQSGKRAATVLTSRGCPYSCAFCFNMSRTTRFHPARTIKKELKDLKELGFESIYFMDDVFTLNKERMNTITKYAKELDMPFRATTRANLINESKLEILANNGCEWLSFGIESGNDEVLNNSNKKMTTKQNYNAVRLANDYGINTKGFFIIGLPGETEETARQTIDFSLSLRDNGLKQADFYFLTPFPGTPIWNDPKKYGIEIKHRDFTKYLQAGKGAECVVNTEKLSSKEIENFVGIAKKEWSR